VVVRLVSIATVTEVPVRLPSFFPALFLLAASGQVFAADKPNVVVILADDRD